MKLLSKTSRYYILYSIPVILFSSVFFYFFLLHEVGESNESILLMRVKAIENYIENDNKNLLDLFEVNNEVYIRKIENDHQIPQYINDTLIFSTVENKFISYKMMVVSAVVKGQNYKIKVLKSTIEYDEIMEVVFVVFSLLLVLLFLVNAYITINISQHLWKPFRDTLTYIKNFNVSTTVHKPLETNEIDEFSELNTSINEMILKMISDYKNQKKFTENASHEFQTPIAIIKGKIDLLLQEETLNESAMKILISIEDATNRLSKINKSLLLLSKIENQQYDKAENVAVQPLLERVKTFNEDFIVDKDITFHSEFKEELDFKMSAELGFILLNNLFQNAIRHNFRDGKINISIQNKKVTISNTGSLEPLDEERIYQRFEKKSANVNSIGLGLAIVKEIADANSITIAYEFAKNMHHFSLSQTKK